MKVTPLPVDGARVVDVEPHVDERGFFARTWCAREFAEAGLPDRMVQGSISYNKRAGTLRGLHYHAFEFPQSRLVRVVRGAAFMALVDLRRDSPTYLRHDALTIRADEHRAVFTPPGTALGFQTLVHDTLIYYLMPEFYEPAHERGVRWDDPAFGIEWPAAERVIKDRDATYPDYDPESDGGA